MILFSVRLKFGFLIFFFVETWLNLWKSRKKIVETMYANRLIKSKYTHPEIFFAIWECCHLRIQFGNIFVKNELQYKLHQTSYFQKECIFDKLWKVTNDRIKNTKSHNKLRFIGFWDNYDLHWIIFG